MVVALLEGVTAEEVGGTWLVRFKDDGGSAEFVGLKESLVTSVSGVLSSSDVNGEVTPTLEWV